LQKEVLGTMPMRMTPIDSDLLIRDKACTVLNAPQGRLSYYEYFASKFNVPLSPEAIQTSYRCSEEEIKWAKETLEPWADKMKFCFIIDCGSHQYGIDIEQW